MLQLRASATGYMVLGLGAHIEDAFLLIPYDLMFFSLVNLEPKLYFLSHYSNLLAKRQSEKNLFTLVSQLNFGTRTKLCRK